MPLTHVAFEQLTADDHKALFVVDYHLDNPPPLGHEEMPGTPDSPPPSSRR